MAAPYSSEIYLFDFPPNELDPANALIHIAHANEMTFITRI